MGGAILIDDHKEIVRKIREKSRKIHGWIHLVSAFLIVGLLLSGWIVNLDYKIILTSYEMIKEERDFILLKHELLQTLRKKPLTLSNALDILEAVSNQRNIPIPIILGIIEQESQFNSKAVSPKGARGPGQLMPIVWRRYGNGTNIHDFLSNITASIAYLTDLYRQFGTWERTLRAYAAGPAHAGDKGIDWYSRAVLAKARVYQSKIER